MDSSALPWLPVLPVLPSAVEPDSAEDQELHKVLQLL